MLDSQVLLSSFFFLLEQYNYFSALKTRTIQFFYTGFFCHFILVLFQIQRFLRGNTVIIIHLMLFFKQKHGGACVTHQRVDTPRVVQASMLGHPAIRHHLLGQCLEDLGALNMVVWCVYHNDRQFDTDNYFFIFFTFFLSLSSLSFAPAPVKFQNNPFNFFSFTFSPYAFDYYFFLYFRIGYKIINDFQFHPLLFF